MFQSVYTYITTLLFCLTFTISYAQDEIYEPIQIQDTITRETEKETSTTSDTKKNTKVKDDAITELDKKKELLNRIRVGLGNINIQIGAITFISIAPTIGYMVIKNRLELGLGPILMYQRIRYTNGFTQSAFVYGGDLYAKGYLYKGLFLQARYDIVNKPSNVDLNRRLNVHHLLLGAGYTQAMGKVGFFNASVLFNVIRSNESIYRGTFGDNFPLMLDFGFSFNVAR